jgi:hypothetical protein
MALLKQLRSHKWGWVFNEPVDPEVLGCTDYYQVIKTPMDLGTVKKRLDDGSYESPDAFAAEVRLIWANAKL